MQLCGLDAYFGSASCIPAAINAQIPTGPCPATEYQALPNAPFRASVSPPLWALTMTGSIQRP
jgi:hypothetical protein